MARLLVILVAAAALLAPPARADALCPTSDNGICEEPYIGLGLCPINSDLADCADYSIFPYSDSEPLSADDLFEQSPEKLRLGRNEIFARHGRTFQSEDLQSWFERRSWYQPQEGEPRLSAVEAANVQRLKLEETAQQADAVHESGLPRPRVELVGTYVYADGTRVRVERIDGDEFIRQVDPDGAERERLYRNATREIWDPAPAEGYVTVYSAWYDAALLLRQPALLVQLSPVFEGREELEGETLLRFRLTLNIAPDQFWRGQVWLTEDGVVVRADVTFRTFLEEEDRSVVFELKEWERRPVDPAGLEPPRGLEVNFAG